MIGAASIIDETIVNGVKDKISIITDPEKVTTRDIWMKVLKPTELADPKAIGEYLDAFSEYTRNVPEPHYKLLGVVQGAQDLLRKRWDNDFIRFMDGSSSLITGTWPLLRDTPLAERLLQSISLQHKEWRKTTHERVGTKDIVYWHLSTGHASYESLMDLK